MGAPTGPAWYILLILPLLAYLMWRPITLFMAKKAIEASIPPPPARRPKPSPAQPAAPGRTPSERYTPVEEEPEPGPRKGHWSIKASDHYLWNFGGGGAAPMMVNWAGAAPPSAPRKKNDQTNRVRMGAAGKSPLI